MPPPTSKAEQFRARADDCLAAALRHRALWGWRSSAATKWAARFDHLALDRVEFDQLRRLSAVLLIEKSLARCSGDHLALDRRCLKRAGADAGLSVNEPHPRVDEKGSPRLSSHPPTIPGDT